MCTMAPQSTFISEWKDTLMFVPKSAIEGNTVTFDHFQIYSEIKVRNNYLYVLGFKFDYLSILKILVPFLILLSVVAKSSVILFFSSVILSSVSTGFFFIKWDRAPFDM